MMALVIVNATERAANTIHGFTLFASEAEEHPYPLTRQQRLGVGSHRLLPATKTLGHQLVGVKRLLCICYSRRLI
jgi:hypothetical protein